MILRKFLKVSLLLVSISFFNCLHAEEGSHLYHASIFGGLTTVQKYSDATFGLDIERYLNPQFGISLIGDFAVNNHAHQIAALGFVYHFAPQAKFVLAPGAEFVGTRAKFLVRVGLGYDFKLSDKLTLGPVVNADFVKGYATAWVYGVALGMGF